MIKFEKPDVWGWEHAIRGMRNPLNSWERSDSYPAVDCGKCGISQRSQAGRVAYVLRLDSHPPSWFALEGRCG